jgi:hypothetical protein
VSDTNDDDAGGYKRPPPRSRFRAEQSGNPKGRPKGGRNLKTDLSALMKKAGAIKDCSRRGDLILEPFGGSGPTLLAAEKTKRRPALIELDPLYCDVIIRRWQKLTGRPATRAAGGMSFADREAQTQSSSVCLSPADSADVAVAGEPPP